MLSGFHALKDVVSSVSLPPSKSTRSRLCCANAQTEFWVFFCIFWGSSPADPAADVPGRLHHRAVQRLRQRWVCGFSDACTWRCMHPLVVGCGMPSLSLAVLVSGRHGVCRPRSCLIMPELDAPNMLACYETVLFLFRSCRLCRVVRRGAERQRLQRPQEERERALHPDGRPQDLQSVRGANGANANAKAVRRQPTVAAFHRFVSWRGQRETLWSRHL